jgi:parvulin-like peptidyl-prolyl isomerase
MVLAAWLLLPGGGMAATAPPPSEAPTQAPPATPGQLQAPTPETVTADTVMAEVNGVKITYGELEKNVREQIPNVTGHGTISSGRLRARALVMLEEMITDELVLQEAKRLRISVDGKQVDAELKRQRGRFPTAEKYEEALKQRHLTEKMFRQRLERAVLIQQVITHEVTDKVTVTDDDLAAYYHDHQDKFQIPMQYRLRLLLVSVDPSATSDDWEQARKRALDFKSRGSTSENFAALAREFSGDVETKKKGGDTGLVHHGQLGLTDVEDAVEPLKPGEITDPVRTIYGFYLARVEEKRPGRQQTFEEVNKPLFRQELMEARRRERYGEWMNGLRSQAKITRLFADAKGS